MIIKQIAGEGPTPGTAAQDSVFVAIKNSTGGALSAGYLVGWNTTLAASANGLDVAKPATSNLTNFAGVVNSPDGDTGYSIADQGTGLACAKGVCDVFFRAESTDVGPHVEGTTLGPANAQWYAISNGRSYEFGPLVLMSRLAATTFEARIPMNVRAL